MDGSIQPTVDVPAGAPDPVEVEVVVEIPRWSFLKRGSTGHIDFVSPLPCPFNYGCVPRYIGLEGDLLDAVVLGPRLAVATHLKTRAWGAVVLADRGMIDDKLICAPRPPTEAEWAGVLRFFRLYARCKGLLNFVRGQRGRMGCDGWIEARQAIGRARPRGLDWRGPSIRY